MAVYHCKDHNITIGRVDASAAGGSLKLTHSIIEYKTPFQYQGEPCSQSNIWVKQTAILSINFLKKPPEALWSYDNKTPTVHLSIWTSLWASNMMHHPNTHTQHHKQDSNTKSQQYIAHTTK
jgi:hypothetical protein